MVCALLPPPPPPLLAGHGTPQVGQARRLPMRHLRVCGGRHCVYHLEPQSASTSRCGHRPYRASRHPAHLRTAPPCCPPALVMADLEHRGHQRCGPRRRRVRRAVQPRVPRARRKQTPKGGRRVGGQSFFSFSFWARTVSHIPVRAFCVGRGRGGSGGGGSGPSTVSTRALVAAGCAVSGGGAGGVALCALRPVLIPPGAPRGSQAPGAAWAGAKHAPRTLGGIGAC